MNDVDGTLRNTIHHQSFQGVKHFLGKRSLKIAFDTLIPPETTRGLPR